MTALDRVSPQRLLMYIRNTLGKSMDQFINEPNDLLTRSMVASTLDSFLGDIEQRGGLEQFKVVCDEENNPPKVRNGNMLVCDVYIQPRCVTHFINITVAVNSGTLVLDSSILTKEDTYAAYERAMSILGAR